MTDLKTYLTIQKDNLDDELIHQASLLQAASEAYEQACADRDNTKESLAVTDAKLDNVYRQQLGQKVTEAAVKAHVQSDPAHITAWNEYIKAKLDAGIAGTLVDAFTDKSHNLRKLCDLYLSAYYERSSVKPSSSTNETVYTRQRQRLAEARLSKEKRDNAS